MFLGRNISRMCPAMLPAWATKKELDGVPRMAKAPLIPATVDAKSITRSVWGRESLT